MMQIGKNVMTACVIYQLQLFPVKTALLFIHVSPFNK